MRFFEIHVVMAVNSLSVLKEVELKLHDHLQYVSSCAIGSISHGNILYCKWLNALSYNVEIVISVA